MEVDPMIPTTKSKTVLKSIRFLALGLTAFWSFAMTAQAAIVEPVTKTITVTATLEPTFEADFTFIKNTKPCPETDTSGWVTLGLTPAFTYTLTPILPDGKVGLLTTKEGYHIIIGVLNNTGRQYFITQTAVAPTGPGGSIDSAFVVNCFIDPKDGLAGAGTGTGGIWVASKKPQLFASTAKGDDNVIQIVYGISSGYNCDGVKVIDDGANGGFKALPPTFQAGTYADGGVTLTVDLQ